MIVIIDYGAGNLRSVKNALDRMGVSSLITDEKELILKADKVIFPGQGHFGACVAALKEKGLFDLIRDVACAKPFLGICVGMQLLFETSEEAVGISGLGILKGKVKKFSLGQKLPQMGWNRVQSRDIERLDDQFYYFANSYFCVPEEEKCILARGFYGEPFVCAVEKGELLAVQFHPEKSGREGMKILEYFARGKRC
jgi:imidazole glycerol phosphate synthase glutamine amidotransferase subunit